MKYFGEKCPVCESIFADGDDIVVCPECGTPAHRECWNNVGKCMNEDKHGEFSWKPTEAEYIKVEPLNVENPEPDSSVSKLCPFCSARNDEDALTCTNCGSPLTEEQAMPFMNEPFNHTGPEKEIDGVKVSKIAKFVQVNYTRYIQKFTRISNKKLSFNWSAFLFNPYWFFFRKLYYIGGIFLGVQLLLSLFLSFVMMRLGIDSFLEEYATVMASATMAEMQNFILESIPELIKTIIISSIALIPNLIAGFVADGIYKRNAFKNIKKIEESGESDNIGTYIKNGAGVSLLAAGLSIFGYEALITLLSILTSWL